MRWICLVAVLGIGLGAAARADPIEGVWQTQPDEGAFAYVTIAPCGGAFCGVISRTWNAAVPYASPNIGKRIVLDMVPEGGGRYAGKVWRPSNGKTYTGRITLSGDRMDLRGCIAGGLLCARQVWQRVQ